MKVLSKSEVTEILSVKFKINKHNLTNDVLVLFV